VSEASKQTGGRNGRLDLEYFEAEREATLAHDRAVITSRGAKIRKETVANGPGVARFGSTRFATGSPRYRGSKG
jgi:hypothetical protein